MFSISNEAGKKVNQAILVSGSARSGTTIVGKIIHSFEGVEYAFEPPLTYSLIPLINKMPEEQWRLLYETYLYEDFFVNAICGRHINCNQSDDSSIYRVKDKNEIEARLSQSTGKSEAEQTAAGSVIAYKMPDIVSYIPRLQDYYPGTRVVIVDRGHSETLNSLLRKEWFTNENANKNLIWPFTWYKDMQIPFWVREEDFDDWCQMSPLDRCAYYYLETMKSTERVKNKIIVQYQDLLDAPEDTVKTLAGTLGLSFGPKTKEILATVKPTSSERNPHILDQVDSSLRAQILQLTGRP